MNGRSRGEKLAGVEVDKLEVVGMNEEEEE